MDRKWTGPKCDERLCLQAFSHFKVGQSGPPFRFQRPAHEAVATNTAMTTETQKRGLMREARRKLRMTQLTLARRVGCTESLITKIETGRSTPQPWLKEVIAGELNINTWEVGQ